MAVKTASEGAGSGGYFSPPDSRRSRPVPSAHECSSVGTATTGTLKSDGTAASDRAVRQVPGQNRAVRGLNWPPESRRSTSRLQCR